MAVLYLLSCWALFRYQHFQRLTFIQVLLHAWDSADALSYFKRRSTFSKSTRQSTLALIYAQRRLMFASCRCHVRADRAVNYSTVKPLMQVLNIHSKTLVRSEYAMLFAWSLEICSETNRILRGLRDKHIQCSHTFLTGVAGEKHFCSSAVMGSKPVLLMMTRKLQGSLVFGEVQD